MISVLYVISDLNRGGAESHLLRVLPALKARGLKVSVLTLRERGSLAPKFEECGIKVVSPVWPYPKRNKLVVTVWYVLRFFQLFSYFLMFRPKIVHFFLPQSYLIGGFAACLAGISIKVMSRRSLNYYQQKYPNLVRRFELWLHNRMSMILGNSQKVIDQLQFDEKVSPSKLKLIYNGIGCFSKKPIDIRKELEISKQSVVMTKVANLIPYKGHEDVINACAQLGSDVDWTLLLVGNDSANIQAHLSAKIDKLGLSKHIFFLGSRTDIEVILKGSDIGLLASHEEGFSNAILEGMAAKLPMIVTDVGGNAEAVVENETGFVVSDRNPNDFATAMRKLLKDEGLRKDMGAKGCERQKALFSLERCVDDYQELYESLWDK